MRQRLTQKQKAILLVGVQLFIIALLFGVGHYRAEKQQPILVPLEQFTTLQGNAALEISASQISAFFDANLPEGETTIFRSAPMTLRRGSYLVKAEYESSIDDNSITLISSQNVTGIMESSRPNLALKKTHVEVPVTFRRGVQDAQIELTYAGGTMKIMSITVYATSALWNTQVLALLFIFALFDFLFWLLKNKTKQEVGRYALVTAIGLFASLPLFTDYFTPGIDLSFHLTRIEGIKGALLSGQFPVRMQAFWYDGTGYPVSVMYGDAFLYFPALLRILGMNVGDALNVFRVSLNLFTASFAYLAFQKIFKHTKIALLGAGLYTLCLYRLTNLFNRGALGEAIAMAFFPLILLGLYQIYFETSPKNKGWLWLTVGLSGLINSHILSCEMAAGVILLWALAFLRRTLHWNTIKQFLKAGVVTLGINLWFLLPFLDYSRLPLRVFVKEAQTLNHTGVFLPQIFMMFPNVTGMEVFAKDGYLNEMAYSLGTAFLIGIFGLLYALYTFWRQKREVRENEIMMLGIISLVIGGIIITASLSIFPMDLLQRVSPMVSKIISTIQVLSRLLTPASAVLVLAICCGMWMLCKKQAPYRQAVAFAMCLCSVVSAMYFFDEGMARTWDARRYYDETRLHLYTNHSANEYLYEGTEPSALALAVTHTENPDVFVENSEQEYLDLSIRCKNIGQTSGTITTPLLYYPYYHAENAQGGEALPVNLGTNNLLQFELPAGFDGTVKIYYQEPWFWRFAEMISCVSLAGTVLWQLFQKRGLDKKMKKGTA